MYFFLAFHYLIYYFVTDFHNPCIKIQIIGSIMMMILFFVHELITFNETTIE